MDYAEGNILENKIRMIVREELNLFFSEIQQAEKKEKGN